MLVTGNARETTPFCATFCYAHVQKKRARVSLSPSNCLCENILRWFLARLFIERKLAKILETSPTYSRWRRRQLSAIYNGPELCEIYVMLLNVKYFVIAIQCTNLQTEGVRTRGRAAEHGSLAKGLLLERARLQSHFCDSLTDDFSTGSTMRNNYGYWVLVVKNVSVCVCVSVCVGVKQRSVWAGKANEWTKNISVICLTRIYNANLEDSGKTKNTNAVADMWYKGRVCDI